MWDENSSWGYFNQEGTWWKIEDGKAEQSTEEAALNDSRGSDSGRGVYFLIYTNPNPSGHLANLPQLNTVFRLAVDSDNHLLDSEILSLQTEAQIEPNPSNQELQPQNQPPELPARRVLAETHVN